MSDTSMRFMAPRATLAAVGRIPHAGGTRAGFELMDRNERTIDLPPEVMRELQQLMTPEALRMYPEPEPLYQQLASWLSLPREMLLLSAGADGGLRSVYDAFVQPGDEVVSVAPSYGMYPVYGQMAGAVSREVRFDEHLLLPLERILSAITAKTKLVVLANPNQPIERVYTPSEIDTLLEACGAHGALLVMDEAYHEFCSQSAMPKLNTCGHLIVVRSFSKAFGMAGLRLGYVASRPENIAHLNAVRPAHEAHSIAIAVARYLLSHDELMRSYVAEVKASLAFLAAALRRLGFEARGQWTNSLLVSLPLDLQASDLAEALKQRGFLVRAEQQRPLTNHLRVTVGPRAQAERFLAALERVLAERKLQPAGI